MRTIRVNGVDVRLATVRELKEHGIELSEEITRLEGLGLVIISRLTLKDVLQIAGHNLRKIDYAVPEDWARQNGKDPMEYVWSYERPGSIFGEPLSIRRVRKEARDNITEALITLEASA